MKFKSIVFSQASGSIAGMTYSRNAGGMYVRSRAVPTNPNSDAQQAVRSAMAQLVVYWGTTLTSLQRENWNTYAFNTPTLDRLGEPTHKTGQQMFLRGNVSRLQAGLPIAEDAPVVFDLGDFTPVGPLIADESGQTISIAFTNTDGWASEPDSAILVYQSRPQNPTRNFGKGPYQLLMAIPGATPIPPLSPETPASLFPFTAGQKFFFQVRVTRADGRLSATQTVTTIAVA